MAFIERHAPVPPRHPATVGVVVTAFRNEREIGQALAAIAAQTQLPDAVVVVDDGSDDRTVDVVRCWASVLPLELVVLDHHGGVARARNAALRRLDTTLVTLLDADDVPLPDHLLTLADLHARHGGIVSARTLTWLPGVPPRAEQPHLRQLLHPGRDQLRRLVRANFVSANALVSRVDVTDIGGFREGDRNQDTTADWDLWLRLVAAGRSVSIPAVPTVLRRLRPGRLTDDRGNRLRCEIRQLERSRELVGPTLADEVDEAIAGRQAELRLLHALTPPPRAHTPACRTIALSRLAFGPGGGDWRHRRDALTHLVAPGVGRRTLERRQRS